MDRINVLGVQIDATNILQVIERIDRLIMDEAKGYVTVTGVHGIIESQRSEAVKSAHDEALLSVPDGMPLVYIGRAQGYKEMRRCYGPTLMAMLLKHSVAKEHTHFFYGGNEGVAPRLRSILQEKYCGIKIVGTFTPPFRPLNEMEKSQLIANINNLRPNILWVGLSTPKQEVFMREYVHLLDTNVIFGVGAAFDIHLGTISSAPQWMQILALEWLYRLVQEPRRLWKRYLVNNPLFIIYYCLQLLRLKKYDG